MPKPRLITIPLSHYCERARWALDRAAVDYFEDKHLQRFHLTAVRKVAKTRTVPVLVAGDEVLTDSHDIVRFADAETTENLCEGLSSEDCELEKALEGEFGVETRRLVYDWMLPERKLLLKYNNIGASAFQNFAVHLISPMLERQVRKLFEINDKTVPRAKEVIAAQLDAVAARLDDGRPYITGEHFTTVDLTFASMAALLIMPPQYGSPFPPLEELPPHLRQEVESYRSHPAGAFAMKLYAGERGGPRSN